MSIGGGPANAGLRELESFLVGPRSGLPDPALLQRHAIAGFAYALGSGTEPHPTLRHEYVVGVTAHLATRAALVPLVTAWREAGIEVLLFKGFYLADALYDSPGGRRYHDADVVVRPDDARRAIEIAAGLGWRTVAARGAPTRVDPTGHMEAVLESGVTLVDLHRYVVHSTPNSAATARRITEAAWAASREIEWWGTTVRELDPYDGLLLGTILSRAWSGDGWGIRASDILDMRLHVEHFGCTREGLEERARVLGCPRTLALFLRRCDPWAGRVDLAPPPLWRRRWWDALVARERGGFGGRRRLLHLRRASIPQLIELLPLMWRVRRALTAGGDPAAVLERVDHTTSARTWAAVARGDLDRLFASVRVLALALVPHGDRCQVRSIVLYRLLQAQGLQVRLTFGIETTARGTRRHAWLTRDEAGPELAAYWNACRSDEVVATFTRETTTREPVLASSEHRPS